MREWGSPGSKLNDQHSREIELGIEALDISKSRKVWYQPCGAGDRTTSQPNCRNVPITRLFTFVCPLPTKRLVEVKVIGPSLELL